MEALYFTATWCQPCKIFGPVMSQLDIPVKKVDISEGSDLVSEFQIMSVPTVVIIKDDLELDRRVGAQTLDMVKEWISGLGD